MIKLTARKLDKLIIKGYQGERISTNEWRLNTIGGKLYIKFIDNIFVHMKFENPDLANKNVRYKDRLNPFSGKFNFHWFRNTTYDYKIAELTSYLTNLVIKFPETQH